MNQDYTFKVVKSKTETLDGVTNKKLIIESTKGLYLAIYISNYFDVDSINFMNRRDDYLAGYFELQCSLGDALDYLLAELNNKTEDSIFLSLKWEKFSKAFKDWFNTKLIPLLEKEFEISQLIFEE